LSISLAILLPDRGGGGIGTFYAPHFDVKDYGSLRSTAIDANPFAVASGDRTFNGSAFPPSLIHYLDVARHAYARGVESGADVLETCDWPLGFVPAVVEQRIPYVVQCHGSMGQIAEHDPQSGSQLAEALVQLIEPQLLRAAHRLQTLSRSNQALWERKTGRSVTLIRPAFKPPPLPADVSLEAVGRTFGRLQRWKGPHILCEALQRLGLKAPRIEWYGGVKPWGTGDWPADRRLAEDYPTVWGSKLVHKAPLPRNQVFALQASALFNLVPSTWDVFNFTAVEAMAAARPTVISTGAGASELIVDGQNGFVFENGDSEGLAAVIDRLLAMPEAERRKIGRAGRETIAVELAPDLIMRQRLEAYEEAIRSFHDSPPPRPDDWLVSLLTPGPKSFSNFDALLDPVPLRTIGEHMVRRILDKTRRRGSR
jgi:glycosyltransferase involved in cell wall biosynthesis